MGSSSNWNFLLQRWPDPSELRVGLGCMRLSTEEGRDEDLATETIAAAAQAGITLFDTARAYGLGEDDLGHNERLLAAALRACGAERSARIVTKGGMSRTGGGWVPDGRAKSILADCEASLLALDGLPIDLYLIHSPDPRTPWRSSVHTLARLVDEGLVKRVGVSNVNRAQLDEAFELAPITAVEVALSVFDDHAIRGGVIHRCAELAIAVIAHSPLGGPRRANTLARQRALADVADAHGVYPAEVALAWLLELFPCVVAIPGARRPGTARSAAHAATLRLGSGDRALLAPLVASRSAHRNSQPASRPGEVVIVMGIPGAGKTRLAEEYVVRGYVRLNRDERGGGLRELADELEEGLSSGASRIVLDNTYLSRAARSYVVDAASRHAIPTRCVWLNTPLAQAQINLVERLLDQFGALPTPDELRILARRAEGVLTPTSQMRAARELEPPSADEGFASVEVVQFARVEGGSRTASGVFVAAAALRRAGWENALASHAPDAPHLIFDWVPGGELQMLGPCIAQLRAVVSGPIETALCPHPGGPPRCWCRPPLPGLPLVFARAHHLEPARSILIGAGPAHRTLATALGARYLGA